ncbi:TIGR03668 family PPOX class F420-dependent oxidoreductase [Mycobacterium sp. MYCO198283]|uniref:TIGR03668 family PPOX class F420-dependent oxidoreductase n=1 Tax=Mycobacterium sp. MYCO198283 TaxID=2883505 RepID=UPI001E5EE6B1|nr:TIGR03668 family PPOX class F420-dependent oxidoreductase [Mycobacterium sp. MYCO198283]MCG5434434.1 TIGR03668 family PPOX class F420-dependent oxidoreductase [Mycobacterium sp. MYCO198283]
MDAPASTDDPAAAFGAAPVARLATCGADAPHLVPVVFALQRSDAGDVVYTAVDAKPKTTPRLRRLRNIERNPHVSLLVDEYHDDWSALWWVRADGTAAIHAAGSGLAAGYAALRAKYPQYRTVSLTGPVIAVSVTRWTSWRG